MHQAETDFIAAAVNLTPKWIATLRQRTHTQCFQFGVQDR